MTIDHPWETGGDGRAGGGKQLQWFLQIEVPQ